MITEIAAAEVAIAAAIKAVGLERGATPHGEKSEIREIHRQLKAALPFVERAKKRAKKL